MAGQQWSQTLQAVRDQLVSLAKASSPLPGTNGEWYDVGRASPSVSHSMLQVSSIWSQSQWHQAFEILVGGTAPCLTHVFLHAQTCIGDIPLDTFYSSSLQLQVK